jgi:7-cyano-7-deazaguanine synthase in queuosine biosynthesis
MLRAFYLVNLKKYEVIHVITFIYGQKHQREIEFAKTIAQHFYNLEHILVGYQIWPDSV